MNQLRDFARLGGALRNSYVAPGREPARTEPDQTAVTSSALHDALDYQRDLWERSILFAETLRHRAENMIEHERAGLPPLLDFEYEMVLDARRLPRPANYALLRVVRAGPDRWADCVDATKPPLMILDPRAGHGPGIGGFKRDSEVGVALQEGHPVYFVAFFPEPSAGQTLVDVLAALRAFVDAVRERHDGAPPVLYGNCQAGWTAAIMSADCEGLVGPAVLNGSPLSYWAGEPGVNPMRMAGAFTGGAWLVEFLSDLGDGRFDGAWLVQNFENLKPEATVEKYANLLTNVDDERERFLDFERWWSGFYFLSREEIVAIVEDLFIGNKLESGKIRVCDGCEVDLRRIRNPLVIFASHGDNITPPHQALGWIPQVYADTADLKQAGQRIVYLTNPSVGHLGLFVSAKVVRFEHRAILESLADIEALPAGLYEMKIDNPTHDPDCHKPYYSVRFEPRRVEDLAHEHPRTSFERVRQASELNAAFYRTFVRPWVRLASNPWTAEMLKWTHPMRASRYVMSSRFLPWMGMLEPLSELITRDRRPLEPDHPWIKAEREAIARTTGAIEAWRRDRDEAAEYLFAMAYGAPHRGTRGPSVGSLSSSGDVARDGRTPEEGTPVEGAMR